MNTPSSIFFTIATPAAGAKIVTAPAGIFLLRTEQILRSRFGPGVRLQAFVDAAEWRNPSWDGDRVTIAPQEL